MENIDIITGLSLEEGKTSSFEAKSMCLNCSFCKEMKCTNEANMAGAKEKIMAAVPNGYELTEIKLSPLTLKDPSKKCKNWVLDAETVTNHIISLFK